MRLFVDRKKASDFPQGLLDLFDLYVHGEMTRRAFLDRAQKFAAGGLGASALFEMLKPNYAWAIQVPPDDSRIVAKRVDRALAARQRQHQGLSRPARRARTNCPAVLVVHENRGLEPVYRRRGAAPGDRQFHRLRPRRLDLGRRLSRRRREGRGAVRPGRPGQDAGGFRRGGAVAEVAARLRPASSARSASVSAAASSTS